MRSLILFTAAGRSYCVRDAIDLAEFTGQLHLLRDQVRAGLACLDCAHELGYELAPNALQRSVEEWRYRHDLISAEQTRAWLQRHRLALDDLAQHFEAMLWRNRFMNELDRVVSEYSPAPSEVEARLLPYLAISWELEGLAKELAWRVCSMLERHDTIPDSPLLQLLPALKSSFYELRSLVITPEACRAQIAATRLALMQVEYESASFAGQDEAREAYLCVHEDGEELEAVSVRGGGEYRRCQHFSDDLPPDIRAGCLSGSPGESYFLPCSEGGFQVLRLLRKREPELRDEAVRERVEVQLLESTFSILARRHIHWSRDAG